MLFFGNVDKPLIPYKDLTDLSLRIIPSTTTKEDVGWLKHDYSTHGGNIEDCEYYNPQNVYSKVGYWNGEIYRFGVVYIMPDDSLSPVFNIRGGNNITRDFSDFADIPLYELDPGTGEQIRKYIVIQENGLMSVGGKHLENTKGVVKFDLEKATDPAILAENPNIIGEDGNLHPLGIKFNINDDVVEEIKKFAKGFFFVRQKRIPTILG